MSSCSQRIRDQALKLGFDLVGFAPARPAEHADAFFRWLENGCHAGMGWMARDPQTRADPTRLLAGAQSIVCVGLACQAETPPPEYWDDPLRGRVARFAWGPDYHDLITPRLEELARFISSDCGQPLAWKVGVDSAPILERDHAVRAGLGFIGKSTLLISPRLGPLVLLGELLLAVELDAYDTPLHRPQACCETHIRCQSACPTSALTQPYQLDARRCISWLTIENKGAIPEELRPKIGRWIFGCDECQINCQRSAVSRQPATVAKDHTVFHFQPEISTPRLDELLTLDERAYRERFAGTPLTRTKRRGLLRNAAIALGNSGATAARATLERAATDADELIRTHAAWALHRLETARNG